MPLNFGRPAAPVRLVGREKGMAQVVDALLAAGGRGGVVLIEGEAGMGKSTLVDAALAAAQEQVEGLMVHRAGAEELDQHRPFGLVADCLGLGPGSATALVADLAERLRRPLPAPGSADVATIEFSLGEALLDLIDQLAAIGPVVLVVEDLQWADPASLVLLHRLVRATPRLGVTLVCSSRPSAREEVAAFVASLRGRADVTAVGLEPLTPDATHEVIQSLLGAPPGPRLVRGLEVAGGNPLMLTELVKAFVADGAVNIDADGTAETEGDGPWPSLSVAVLGRLSQLPPPTRHLLGVAAVLGERFSATELAHMVGRPVGSLSGPIEEALAAGVMIDDGERLGFGHELVRRALYDDLPTGLRSGLHRDAAQVLERLGAPAGRVAEHLMRGAAPGDPEALRGLRAAAEQIAEEAPSVALELWDRALELAGPGAPGRAELVAGRALCLVRSGDLVQGEAACRAALELGVPETWERALRARRARALLDLGRAAEAAEETRRAAAGDGPLLWAEARFEAWSSQIPLFTGDLEGALAAGRRAEATAVAAGDAPALVIARLTLAHVANCRARFEEGEAVARSAVELAEADARWEAKETMSHLVHAMLLTELDELDEAAVVARRGREVGEDIGVPRNVLFAHQVEAQVLHVAGRLDDALVELETATTLAEEHGHSAQVAGMCLRALITLHRHGPERAETLLERAEAALACDEIGYRTVWLPWVRACCREATGQPAAALEVLWPAWEACRSGGAAFEHRLLGPDVAALAVAAGDRERARAAATEVEAVAARNPRSASLAGAAGRARGLAEDDPDALVAAVAAYRRGPRRLELARAAEDAASGLARAGRREEAVALAREALGLYAETGADWRLTRARAELRRVGLHPGAQGGRRRPATGWEALTPTEVKVAGLVASGLTNPEVAASLYLSRRTVQTHVSHILAKLGFSSRLQLAAAARQRSTGWSSEVEQV